MDVCPAGPHTHSLEATCLMLGCESPDWLVDRVRSGVFPARRIVRELRFSDADIEVIIERCAVESKSLPRPTARSRQKHSQDSVVAINGGVAVHA